MPGKNEQEVNNVQRQQHRHQQQRQQLLSYACVRGKEFGGGKAGDGAGRVGGIWGGGGQWGCQTDGQPMRCILLGASMHFYRGLGTVFFPSIWGVVGFVRFLCVQQQQQQQRSWQLKRAENNALYWHF